MDALIFEEVTSVLYRSNDGVLEAGQHDRVYFVFNRRTEEILIETRIRPVVDAYIAGYDECERLTREG